MNVSLCPALEAGTATVVAVWHSLGQAVSAEPVRLAAGFPPGVASWTVTDATGQRITAQVVPLSPRDRALRALYGADAGADVRWLCFVAPLPAAGFSTFALEPSPSAVDSTFASVVTRAAADASISNGLVTLTVSSATGFLSAWRGADGLLQPLRQSWLAYAAANATAVINGTKQASGAYIFRPESSVAAPLAAGAAAVTLAQGPVVNMSWHDGFSFVTQETRLWAGAEAAELAWTVGPVDVAAGGREVVLRVETDLPTAGRWASDSNCREAQERVRGARPQWQPAQPFAEPAAANIFPVTCLIRATGGDVTVALAPDRAEGGASLADGALELLVHRRLLFDDGCGLAEALDEPGLDGLGLIVRGSTWLSLSRADDAPRLYQTLQQRSLARPTALMGFSALSGGFRGALASLLATPLPANVHLATVQALTATTALVRLAHMFAPGEDAAGSANATVALADVIAGAVSAVDMTLPGSQPLASAPHSEYRTDDGRVFSGPLLPTPPAGTRLEVELAPMELRTFEVTRA